MIEYTMKDGNSTLRAAGHLPTLCEEATYMLHRLWASMDGEGRERFECMIRSAITDPHSPLFRETNAADIGAFAQSSNAWDGATEKASAKPTVNATAKETDMEDTAWQKEMQLYEGAVKHFGETAQIMQAIEEMAELTQALNKYLRYNQFGQGNLIDALKKVQEERADVEIMLNQLQVIFGDNSDAVCAKLYHLRKLLEPVREWEI